MAVINPIGTIKNWLNVGEVLFGNDLNTNFNVIRAQYNSHTHDEFATMAGNHVITGLHTFNRSGPPFAVGASSHGQLVNGLSAEFLNGLSASDVAVRDRNDTITGDWTMNNVAINGAMNVSGTIDFDGATVDNLSHSSLQNLSSDDHAQYVHVSVDRTVSSLVTFDRSGPPFAISGSSVGQQVDGLNAEFLQGLNPEEVASTGLIFALIFGS